MVSNKSSANSLKLIFCTTDRTLGSCKIRAFRNFRLQINHLAVSAWVDGLAL